MIDLEKLCPGCMKHREHPDKPCPHCGYPEDRLDYPDSLPVFSILAGKYLLGSPLGKGGFGITYIAMYLPDETIVAVKEFFPADLAVRDSDRETVVPQEEAKAVYFRTGMKSFAKEGQILSQLSFVPHIVHVREMLNANHTTYLIMEFVPGIPLKKYMKARNGPFTEKQALDMLHPILLSLDTIHKQNILHRDISPENLMVLPDHTLTLIDFGAARTFSRNDDDNLTVILKRGYAPEEQYHSNSRQGPWTDLYAICAVLYQMLTGILPQEASARAVEDHLTPISQIRGLQLSASTCRALEKGLQLDPMERYPDISSLMKELYPKQTVYESANPSSDSSSQQPSSVVCTESVQSERIFHDEEKTPETIMHEHENTDDTFSRKDTNTSVKPKSRKKRYIIAGIIIALCVDLVFGGPLFFHLRGYRVPWFIRPFTLNRSVSPDSLSDNSVDSTLSSAAEIASVFSFTEETQATVDAIDRAMNVTFDRKLLLANMEDFDTVWQHALLDYSSSETLIYPANNPDYPSDADTLLSYLPAWCDTLGSVWDAFNFQCSSGQSVSDNETLDQILQEESTVAILIADTAVSCPYGQNDYDNTSFVLSKLLDTIYTNISDHILDTRRENGETISDDMIKNVEAEYGMGLIHDIYARAITHTFLVDPELNNSAVTASVSHPLNDVLRRFFEDHAECARLYYDRYSDSYSDIFMQHLNTYLD